MNLGQKLSRRFLRRDRAWTAILLILMSPASLPAAFEGFGSSTPGGNNGAVVEVTSLADSGPGTLREALSRGSNLRIVFKVGGTINLQSRLEIRGRSFITIDGSTAPDPGVTLKGRSLYIRGSHDIIVTHIRVRDSVSDGILVWDGSNNVVIDHCSATNAADENINITEDTHDVTVSWCIIGDTRSNSFALHSKGMLIANFNKPAVTKVSLHHNLFINEFQRSPQVSTAGLFDIRNNVIRDWGAYGIRMRQGAWGNIVNNVFDTNNNPEDAVVLVSDAGPVYIHGNQGPGSRDVDPLSTAASPFPVAPITTDPVAEVESRVLGLAGAFPRDLIDTSFAGAPLPLPEEPVPSGYAVAVNVGGGSYTDGAGNRWSADRAYSSGSWGYTGGRSYSISDPIADTSDDPLYKSERYGTFNYRFDVPDGLYDVTLHFAEIYWKSSGQRIFDVFIEGALVVDNYDIYSVVGHDRATTRTFPGVLVQDGQLNINFVTVKNNPMVSAIRIQSSGN